MKLFECDKCGQVLFFENNVCNSCGSRLGYAFELGKLVVLGEGADEGNVPFLTSAGPHEYFRCKNDVEHDACNWLVTATEGAPAYCRSCTLTEVIPDLSDPTNRAAWVDLERAKRRLVYTLHALELPLTSKIDNPAEGLAFRFLQSTAEQAVMTGHSDGIVTLNIAEANAAFRENMREKLGEAYRTVLGHLRHESGHYYWDRLIRDTAELEAFRELFGDERADYQAAIQRHYEEGPSNEWGNAFISAYATMHPWEDWAETWAHYLHMVDTLETAQCHGLAVRVPGKAGARVTTDTLVLGDFDALCAGWHAVTVAMNSLSRSMGVKDIYPFVLSARVHDKLRFIHRVLVTRTASKGRSILKVRKPASSRGGNVV